MCFELLGADPQSKARLGRLTTLRGVIDTPEFMPVGTQGSAKALDPRELQETGTQILLGNTCPRERLEGRVWAALLSPVGDCGRKPKKGPMLGAADTGSSGSSPRDPPSICG
jgi:hypothetical protein